MKKILLTFITVLLLGAGVWAGLTSLNQQSERSVTSTSQVAGESYETPKPPVASDVEAEVNKLRVEAGLTPLYSDNPVLDRAAEARASSMCATDDWSHKQAWPVLEQFYTWYEAGENLYYGHLQKNMAQNVARDWKNSPSHYKNIVKDYTEMGMGVYLCAEFQGKKNVAIIVNYFGVPR